MTYWLLFIVWFQIFYLIYGHKVVQTFYITGDIKRQIPCCLPPSDTDKARGWKTACQKVKFIYKPIAWYAYFGYKCIFFYKQQIHQLFQPGIYVNDVSLSSS